MVGIVTLVALAAFALSVNLFPNVNNDGVDYIAYSRDLSRGLVHLGYRQIGYPLLLAAERLVSGLFGIETLLFSVLIQRLLLLLGVGYAIWLWRWRSAPVVILALTPSLLAYTNFLLTEGITVPLGLLLACLVAHHFAIVTARPEEISVGLSGLPGGVSEQRLALATAFGATAVALLLLAIRLPFAVFGIVPLVFWVAARRRRVPSLSYGIALLLYVAAAGALTVGMAVENRNELGVFTPVARTERSLFWSAWHLTFTLHPENRSDPALADFYDEGSPYFRIWDIEEENPDYPDQARALSRSTTGLLDAADLSLPRERLFSFLGTLRGGRIDDVRPRVEVILDTDASNVDAAIHWDDISKNQGWEVFNDRYNEGAKPQAVITSPVFPDPPLPYVTTTTRAFLPLSLLGILLLALLIRKRLLGVSFLVPPVVYYAAHGWLLADNARFLMTTTIYAIAGLSALWAHSGLSEGPRYRLDDHAIDHL
ncbi:MAG: hypothetical protein ACRDZM_03350 [Acidimicrobiia bacterium]